MDGADGHCNGSGSVAALPGAAADRARAFLGARQLADLPEEVFRLGEVWALCEGCVARGDAPAAERLYALLAGFAARAGEDPGGYWSGTAARFLGLLAATAGRCEVAATHFEDALRAAASIGAAAEVVQTQFAFARVLLGRGAPGDAVRAQRLLVDLLVGQHPPPVAEPIGAAPAGRAGLGYVFRREGDYWALASGDRVSRVRAMRGFDYIAELLRRPHRSVYVVELMSPAAPSPPPLRPRDAVEHGLHVVAASRGDAGIDPRARRDYRARWQALLGDQADAERDNDLGRAAGIQREIDMLAQELAAGTRGPGRGASSAQERARVNVRNCVSAALRLIRRHDEPLWRHLVNTIKTGTYCVYEPDRAVDWDL
jgi:hypothetical protein